MTQDAAKMLVYSATYRVVRHSDPMPSEDDFLASTVDDVLGSLSAPTDQPLMWYLSAANSINTAFHEAGLFIIGFDGNYLKSNSSKTWQQIVNYILRKIYKY